jgi:hypothetical protein
MAIIVYGDPGKPLSKSDFVVPKQAGAQKIKPPEPTFIGMTVCSELP